MVWEVKAATLPVFFGSGIALLLAVEQLVRKRPGKVNLLFSLIFICCYLIIQGAGFVANEIPPLYPLTLAGFFTAICLVGPLYYFYFLILLHPERQFSVRSLTHFAPAAVVFCLETGFQFLPDDFKRQWLADVFAAPPQNVMILLVLIGALHAFSYLVYLLRMDLRLVWNVRELKAELRILVAVNVSAILAVVTLFVGFTFKISSLFVIGGNVLALLTVSVFLLYNRYPNFLHMLKTQIDKKRYEKSSLTGVDTQQLKTRLMDLLKNDKVFTDAELNLKALAHQLSISSHQLSEYLNDHLDMDFRSFINLFRVDEARKLLLEEPNKSILTICYEVGFGSKSTFNSIFKKETGKTPSEFRKTNTCTG